jgi:hypothetical protein
MTGNVGDREEECTEGFCGKARREETTRKT